MQAGPAGAEEWFHICFENEDGNYRSHDHFQNIFFGDFGRLFAPLKRIPIHIQLQGLGSKSAVRPCHCIVGVAMRYVSHGVRRPFGHGQAALLKNRRNYLATAIAQRLWDRLDMDRVQMTGEVLPRGTLKKVANRKLFEWIHEIEGRRIYTKPLLKLCVKKLLRFVGPIPMDPKLPYGTFVKQQSCRLGSLIRQAKRIKDTWLIWD